MVQKVVYPGSFDPITNGHLDILKRTISIFGNVTVAVLKNHKKKSLFSIEERIELICSVTKDIKEVEIVSFEGLLVDFCNIHNINVVIRGLRTTTDFDYEKVIALVNKSLRKDLETLFLTANSEHAFISSTIVKELASLGGNVSNYVPNEVVMFLKEKYQ